MIWENSLFFSLPFEIIILKNTMCQTDMMLKNA